MWLKVLGSSSSGNCYLLENEKECLILEAGIDFKEVLKALDFNIKKVVGCLITHEHKDHSRYVNEFLKNGIKVYTSQGTKEQLEINSPNLIAIEPNKVFVVGGYRVIAFNTKHDCAEPVGFYIRHKETGNILFATDTYYIPNRFKDLNNILIECNYSHELLAENIEKNLIPVSLKNRIIQSHMELETCLDCLRENDTRQVNNVVLIHLSGNNSDERLFKNEVEKILPFANVYVASKGLSITFDKYSF